MHAIYALAVLKFYLLLSTIKNTFHNICKTLTLSIKTIMYKLVNKNVNSHT